MEAQSTHYQQKPFLEAILKCLGESICVIDRNLTIQWVNEAFEKHGGSLDQIKGRHCYQAFYHRLAECIDCPTLKAFKTGQIIRTIQLGYDQRIYEVTASPIKSNDGTINYVVELTRDITEKKILEEDLRTANKNLSARIRELNSLYALSTHGMSSDEDSTFFKNLTSVTSQTFSHLKSIAILCLDIHSDEKLRIESYSATEKVPDISSIIQAYENIISKIEVFAVDNLIENIDTIFEPMYSAGVRFGMHTPVVIHDKIDAILSLLICDENTIPQASKDFLQEAAKQLHFVLQRSRLEQQLVQSARLATAGELTAGIAHEINNPLYGIKNCIEMIKDSCTCTDDELKQMMNLSLDEIHRIIDLLHKFLTFCSVSEEKTSSIDINGLMKDILLLNHSKFKQNDITVETSFGHLPYIEASPNSIKQVFLNLINNAVDAMSEGGLLKIMTEKKQKHIRVFITDTGVGIAPSRIDKIFQPLYTTKSDVHGVGLGLSVSYGIVKRHHGDISVKSQLNKGSVFIITLPIRQTEP